MIIKSYWGILEMLLILYGINDVETVIMYERL